MRSRGVVWRGLIPAALLFLAGCGDKTTSVVSGRVTFDGRPVEQGVISFFPVDGKTPTAGGEIKGGNYSVKVPVARMKVKISMPKEVGRKKLYNTPDSPSYPVTAEALPARYNTQTELELDVTAGGVEKDWPLTSK